MLYYTSIILSASGHTSQDRPIW